jgi:hypothetical protein
MFNPKLHNILIFFGALFSFSLGAAAQTTLSSITANNTSACPASGTLPVQCQKTFTGQTDTRAQVATPQFDRPAGNVSDEDIHIYLNFGSSTKIYANFMLGFCTTGTGFCNSNVQTGYTSNDANTVGAQAEDLRRRHIDGAIMTWEGDGTSEDSATLAFQSYVNTHHCSGAQNCNPMYFIMYDEPSLKYNVTSTGIPGTSGAGCNPTLNPPTYTATDYENCVVPHLRNDMCYMNGYHWGNNGYQKANGRPIVQVFVSEGTINSIGAAPSWADVWVQIENWNSNLQTNCNKAPYNANNGVPLIIFRDAEGFTHTDSSGSFYWIHPAGTDPQADQFIYNISPASTAGTLDNFYQTAQGYPSDYTWGGAFKGFNSSAASWSPNRIMDQDCGQTWLTSLTESNNYYQSNALPYLQIATWNDYNEGTEIESGIDNCYTVGASVSGTFLNWSLNPTNSTLAKLTTVSHVEIYDSPDGQNLTLVASPPTASSGKFDLSTLASGNHTLYVRMVGKNSILNRVSSGVGYTN